MKQLRRYQQEAVERVDDANLYINFSCGLGKTLTAIRAVQRLREQSAPGTPTDALVVVSPKVAVQQWVRELKLEDPTAAVLVLDDNELQPPSGAWPNDGAPCWYVTHHETLLNKSLYAKYLASQTWLCIVADEAHKFNNKDAQRSEALKKLRALRKIAMSGTKIEKQVSDLWSMLNWLDPEQFSSFWRFHDEFVLTVPGYENAVKGISTRAAVGVKNVEKLAAMLRPIILRKTRAQVAPDLPPKQVQFVPIRLSKEQREVYNAIRRADDIEVMTPYGEILVPNSSAKVLRLQQAASYPPLVGVKGVPAAKPDWIDNYVANNPDEQIVVFTRFRETAEHIAQFLDAALVVGGKRERLESFLAGKRQCLVGTIKAMGTALDLPMARTAIYCELERSTIDLRQSADRIHRLTTTIPPNIVFLMAEKSVDWYILQQLTKKLAVDDQIDTYLTKEDSDYEESVTEDEVVSLLGDYG